MNRTNLYELAVAETKSVLNEWLDDPLRSDALAEVVVERLIAKGVIQSTDPDELTDYWATHEPRTGALEPGRTVIGGPTRAERFQEAMEWTLKEHGETLRRLGEGPNDED